MWELCAFAFSAFSAPYLTSTLNLSIRRQAFEHAGKSRCPPEHHTESHPTRQEICVILVLMCLQYLVFIQVCHKEIALWALSDQSSTQNKMLCWVWSLLIGVCVIGWLTGRSLTSMRWRAQGRGRPSSLSFCCHVIKTAGKPSKASCSEDVCFTPET